jgi:hypothetical protein
MEVVLDEVEGEDRTSELPKTTGLGSRSHSRGAMNPVHDDRKGTARLHTPANPRVVLVRRAIGAAEDGAVRRGGGISAEEEAQLAWTRRRSGASWRRVAGAKRSFAGQHTSDVVGVFGDLDEAHASAAARDGAGGDVDGGCR